MTKRSYRTVSAIESVMHLMKTTNPERYRIFGTLLASWHLIVADLAAIANADGADLVKSSRPLMINYRKHQSKIVRSLIIGTAHPAAAHLFNLYEISLLQKITNCFGYPIADKIMTRASENYKVNPIGSDLYWHSRE